MKGITKYMSLAALSVLAVGCTGDFDEINTDPDAYSEAPFANILTYSISNISGTWGQDEYTPNSWAGFAVSHGYPDSYSYLTTANEFGNKWHVSYTVHEQLQDILDRTEDEAEGNKNIRNVAKVLQDYLMLQVVDCFGPCPYSEAWKGDEGNIKPVYDSEKDIYAALAADLKEVADSWADGFGDDDVSEGDKIYNGDVESWQRLCNSLRVRIAMRLSKVEAENSKAVVEEIFNNADKYPVIDDCDDNCYIYSDGTSAYREEWYDNYLSRPNDLCISNIFVTYLLNQEDPRIATLAEKNEDGEYKGFYNGSSDKATAFGQYSLLGKKYLLDAAGFMPIYRACESYFAQAEAAMNGWNVPMTAEEAYNKGVLCSMTDNDISEADGQAYLAAKGKFDGTYTRLYHEMWTSLFKETYEAWALYRRTGYPNEIHESVVTYPNGETCKEYPGQRSNGNHNDVPFRFPYPNREELYNLDNLDAARTGVVDNCWGKKLYWDTRSDQEYY